MTRSDVRANSVVAHVLLRNELTFLLASLRWAGPLRPANRRPIRLCPAPIPSLGLAHLLPRRSTPERRARLPGPPAGEPGGPTRARRAAAAPFRVPSPPSAAARPTAAAASTPPPRSPRSRRPPRPPG